MRAGLPDGCEGRRCAMFSAAAVRRDQLRCRQLPRLERLEDRTLLTVTASLDRNIDAVITGTAGADSVTMSIENQGLANETLRVIDPGGVIAGAGFTQDGRNSATVLSSAITGLDIFINTLE